MSYTALEQAVDNQREDFIRTLQDWIAIPSLKADALPDAPFGAPMRRMLDLSLADAKRLGFAPRDIDGYAADMEIGEGEETIAILAHLDVVPAGEGWKTPPFEGVIADGRMYGRGTSDDKGPAVAAMFAMKAVREAGIPLKKRVRLILGCDEESGWADMAYYAAHIGLPKVGFSPDAVFPLINTEKGILRMDLHADLPEEGDWPVPIYSIHAGQRPNVIPSVAEAEIGGDREAVRHQIEGFARRTGYSIDVETLDNGHLRVLCHGTGGHAAMPELGQNAAARLLQLLRALEAGGGSHAAVELLAQAIGNDTDGTGFGIAGSDSPSGALTINLGILNLADGACDLTLDIRHPVLFDAKQLVSFIGQRVAEAGFVVAAHRASAPHHVPESNPIVQSLLSVYQRVTGLAPYTVAIGGGTYARALELGVAFGSLLPGEEDVAHQANEYMSLETLMLNVRVFAHAIVALAG